VHRAFAEVEDAPVAVRAYRAEHDARLRQVNAARSAAVLSRARYDGGVTSSETLRRYINSVIQLYKALGGGWTDES
jgi:multidrug efflux system outer membrane protein